MNMKLIRPLLCPKAELTSTVGLKILENLREAILPKLPRYKLPQFGDLRCLQNRDGGDRYRALSEDNPEVQLSSIYTPADHGIFYFRDTGERISKLGEERTLCAWGLSKNDGEWIIMKVFLVGVPGKPEGVIWEQAKYVEIGPVSLEVMLKTSGQGVFGVLTAICQEVTDHARRKRTMAEEAEKFAHDVKQLEDIFLHGFI